MAKSFKSDALRKKAMEDTDVRCKHCNSKKHATKDHKKHEDKESKEEEKEEHETEKEEDEEGREGKDEFHG